MAQNSEASVEEILESIKKVIARDNRDSALEVRRLREEEAEHIEQQETSEFPPVLRDEDEGSDEVLDLSDMELEEGFDAGSSAGTDDRDGSDGDDAPLIKEEARGAVQENLAALAMLAEPSARPQIVRSGETSLEGLTRELLRPMLAEWLEENLPGMVEKLVQAEIARIAQKKG